MGFRSLWIQKSGLIVAAWRINLQNFKIQKFGRENFTGDARGMVDLQEIELIKCESRAD